MGNNQSTTVNSSRDLAVRSTASFARSTARTVDGLLEQGLMIAVNKLFGNNTVISSDDRSLKPYTQPLKVDRIYEKLYQHVPVNYGKVDEKGTLNATGSVRLFVKTLSGKTIVTFHDGKCSPEKIKEQIKQKEGIPIDQQRLMFARRELENGKVYEILHDSTAHLVLPVKGGGYGNYYIDKSLYDTQWNFDFRDIQVDSARFERGGRRYIRPLGAMRYAIKVLNIYSDNVWLGTSGDRHYSVPGEWPVAYHGTMETNVSEPLKEGFCTETGRQFTRGRGIYCTPDPKTALLYAETYDYQVNND
ncbi:ubiquitin family domain-containing protein [Ditylenchus destructor]|nr:ubiquitin family domain-containing protein [Ditylenchus destructor]